MIIKRDTFADWLSILHRTVATTDKVPLYQTFCFRDGMIRTFDGVCGTLCRFDTGVEACVDADLLMQLLKTIDSDFDLSADAENKRMLIKTGGKSVHKLPIIGAGTFPDFVPKTYDILLGQNSGIAEAISSVLALNDETKTPQYSGIALSGSHVYALDGKRCTRADLATAVPSDYTLPVRAAKRIAEMGDPAGVVGNKNCITASYGSLLLYSQLNAVSLPTKAIDQQFAMTDVPGKLAEFPESFAKVLNRSRIFANEKTSGVRLISKDGKLTIASRSTSNGESTEEIDASLGCNFDIYVQPSHLLEVLRRTSKFNYASLMGPDARCIRFEGEKFLHLVCLMSPTI